MVIIQAAPKKVYDDRGKLVEVIVSAEDYWSYLRSVVAESDWESLPQHLQNAIDEMLIDEVRDEQNEALALEAVLAEAKE